MKKSEYKVGIDKLYNYLKENSYSESILEVELRDEYIKSVKKNLKKKDLKMIDDNYYNKSIEYDFDSKKFTFYITTENYHHNTTDVEYHQDIQPVVESFKEIYDDLYCKVYDIVKKTIVNEMTKQRIEESILK